MPKINRIVFMGTPDFAVASLKAILKAGYNVVGVITAPDKPAGRGRKLKESEVKVFAKEKGLNILQPTNLKSEEFLSQIKALNADLNVVVAFRMLPEAVWNMPPLGSINLHGSLLPNYRGAAPIHWAVINGEKETGVSTFFLKHQIDTGNIIAQAKTPIGKNETTGEVYNKLMNLGADLLVQTLKKIDEDTFIEMPQDLSKESKHAPKIFKEDCLINWNDTAQNIHNKIRGLNPFPTAFTYLNGKVIKIHGSLLNEVDFKLNPRESEVENKKLFVGTGTVPLEITILQMEGKQKSKAIDFINAYKEELEQNFG